MRFSSNANVASTQNAGQNGSTSDISAYLLMYIGRVGASNRCLELGNNDERLIEYTYEK